jgi:hypothetical protein
MPEVIGTSLAQILPLGDMLLCGHGKPDGIMRYNHPCSILQLIFPSAYFIADCFITHSVAMLLPFYYIQLHISGYAEGRPVYQCVA